MPKESELKIIPRPKPKIPALVNLLFWLALIIFLGSLLGSFYLKSKISSLQERKKELEVKILQLGTKEIQDLQVEIKNISEKIKDFAELLASHKITSEFFELLKDMCHPKVQITFLDLDAENNRINLRAKTENFQTLGEQLLIFGKTEEIKDLKVSNISLTREGKVEFSLNFALAPKFFSKEK